MKKSGDELLETYTEAMDTIPTEDVEASATCAIAVAMPFVIELLADIRDVLVGIEIDLRRPL